MRTNLKTFPPEVEDGELLSWQIIKWKQDFEAELRIIYDTIDRQHPIYIRGFMDCVNQVLGDEEERV